MRKKIKILSLLIILPHLLALAYDKQFRYSGNWLEGYQNYFKLGFLAISILGAGWLVAIAKKEKSYIWLACSVILLVLLLFYLYLAVAIINTSF